MPGSTRGHVAEPGLGIRSQALEQEKEVEVAGLASKKCPLRAKRHERILKG